MKKAAFLLAALMLILSLSACGKQSGDNHDADAKTDPDAVTGEFTKAEYSNNPKIISAEIINGNVLRVRFSSAVTPANGTAYKSIKVKDVPASSMTLADMTRTKDGRYFATVYDFRFSEALDKTAAVSLDGEKNLCKAFTDLDGAWIYSDGDVGITDKKTEIPDVGTRFLCAYYDKESEIFTIQFNKPVRCLVEWNQCLFFSDSSNPTPGMGDSWQMALDTIIPIDETVGDDGETYASKYYLTCINGNNPIPEKGVVRVVENDDAAVTEQTSEENDSDLGRRFVSIDGAPLLADDNTGWDVAYAPYGTETWYKIPNT